MADKLTDRRRKISRYWLDDELVDSMGAIIGPYAVTVYNILSRHANGEGQSFPHIKTIARKGKMSVRQVQTCLAALEKQKMLERTVRKDAKQCPTGNDYALLDVSGWALPQGGVVQVMHQGGAGDAPGGAGDAPPLKETQVKDFSSSEEEESAQAKPKAVNFYTLFVDEWRTAFPGREDPEIDGRRARQLKLRGQDLGPERFTLAVRAYFASQHYQAVQGGHNVKTFLDWPADTWKGKTPRPPAARGIAPAGTLFEQEEEMRRMREAQEHTDQENHDADTL